MEKNHKESILERIVENSINEISNWTREQETIKTALQPRPSELDINKFRGIDLPWDLQLKEIEKQTRLLGQIEENTNLINDLIDLSRESNLNQEELNYIMKAIYELSSSKDKTEANYTFKKVMKKVSDLGENADNYMTIANIMKSIYDIVIKHFD